MGKRHGASSAAAGRISKKLKKLKAKAVPFISFKGEKLQLCPEGCQFIRSIRGAVGVVSVVGNYRTGKSFLMNSLVEAEPGHGFGVGQTINACTRGLWVYTKVLKWNGQRVIVIDTEGLGSLAKQGGGNTHDNRIFAIALLISSLFIYNSAGGAINENAIQSLYLVTKISETVRAKSSDGPVDMSSFMPRFCWVVRDFSLRLVDEEGRVLTSNQYLEDALSPVGQGDADTVRNVLRSYFPKRQCHTLVRPCNDEKTLQQLGSLGSSALRPEFKKQLSNLKSSISDFVRPKRACGKTINGRQLVQLAEAFLTEFNSGKVPVISNTWDMIAESGTRDAYEDSLNGFTEKLDLLLRKELKAPEECEKMTHQLAEDSLKEFREAAFGNPEAVAAVETKLKQMMRSRSDLAVERNFDRLAAHFTNSLREWSQAEVADSQQFKKMSDLRNKATYYSQKLVKGVQNTKGTRNIMASCLAPFVWEWGVQFGASQRSRVKDLTSQLVGLTEKLEASRNEAEEARSDANVAEANSGHVQQQLEEKNEALLQRVAEAEDLLRDKNEVLAAAERSCKRNETLLKDQALKISESEAFRDQLLEDQKERDLVRDTELKQARDNLILQSRDMESKVAKLNAQLHDASLREQRNQEKIGSLEVEADTCRSQASSLRDRMAQLGSVERELEASRQQASRLERQLESVKEEAQESEERLGEAIEKFQNESRQNMQQRDALYNTRSKKQQKMLESALSELTQVKKQYKAEQVSHQSELGAATAYLNEAKQQVDKLKGDLSAQKRATTEAEERYDIEKKEESKSHKKEQERLQALLQASKDSLQEARDEWGRQRVAYELEWSTKCNEATSRAEMAEATKSDLEGRLRESETKSKDTKTTAENEQLKLKVTMLTSEKTWLEKDKESRDSRMDHLQERLTNQERQMREHERQHKLQMASMQTNYEKRINLLEQQMDE